MQKTEAAMILAGVQSEENREASAPTNLHVITGTVVETSESGKAKVSLDGLIFSADNEQSIEIDTLGGLEEGDTATILLSGESGHGMLPMAIGAGGSVDRVVERVKGIEADYVKATLLEAQVAQIGFLKSDSATITNLQAQTAKIESLTAEQLSAATAYIAALTAGSITAESLTADVAKVHNLTADQLSAAAGYISQLTADSVTAQNISAMYGDFATVKANAAKVANLTAQELEADHATIASLDSNYAHITNGVIDNATIGYADVNNLSAHYAEIQNGHINSALINTAAIVDEQVFTVTGNKATLASIDASKINVTNLNADNITVNKINGQPVTGKSISDALSQHETDISTKVDTTTFNNTVDDLNDRIDGAIETFTGTVVPTLNNTPASDWTTTKLRDEHVGDVYYVVNASSQQNGYCYRFTKSGSTYSWQLIKDSDVTAALSRLQTAEGKITTFDSDISTLKTDTGELKTKTQSLETSLGDKVDVTTFNDLSSDVEENSATITTLSNTVSQKADSSTVTTLSNTVNQVKQTADTNKTSITNLTQTVNQKADSSTVTTLTQRTSTIEQNLNGITTRVSATESSISGHPDCWRIDRYSLPARVNTNKVVPVPDDFVEENFLDTRYRKESDMGTNLQIADYYIAKLTTYVHATEATTITDNFRHDDASAVYLNDEHIAEAAGTTVISVTLNLRAGWNKIRFLLNEQTGSDYARFATRISTWSNVDQQVADFNEYEGTVQEQRLKAAKAEIKVTTDGISSEVSKISSAKYVNARATSWTLANLRTYAAEGHQENWNVDSTDGLRVGDVVYVKGTDGTRNVPIYVKTTVKSVQNSTNFTGISHGMEDILPVDSAISSINQSAESVKIQANRVEIDGTAVFNAISSDVDSAITSKGYATTSQAQGYANTAKSEAISTAAADATAKANAVQTNLDNLQVGGRNYIFNSAGVNISGLGSASGSRAEYRALNVGQSYMGIAHGTQVTISFDLYMTVNTANPTILVYNTNNKGPKAFSYSPAGTGNYSGVSLSFTAAAGSVIDKRVSVTGYINDRTSPTLTDNWLEFYSNYGSSNWFSISNIKLEVGNKATDWSPAPEDTEVISERVYYRSNSSTKPSAPTSWVADATGNVWNVWTTKVPPLAANKDAGSIKYLYLWTCEQRKSVSGIFLGCTTVQLDENTTVIDGGNIITHSITANEIAANTITANEMQLGTITSEQIAGGTITSDNIEAGSITFDRFDENALTIDNVSGLNTRLSGIDKSLSSLSNSTQWVHFQNNVGTVFGESGSANNVTITASGIDFNTDEGKAAWATGGVFHANEMESERVETQTIVMGDWAITQSGTTFGIDYIGS